MRYAGKKSLYSPLLECQSDAETDINGSDHLPLPTSNGTIATQPPTEGAGAYGDQRRIGSAHNYEHSTQQRKLCGGRTVLGMHELWQESQEEQGCFRFSISDNMACRKARPALTARPAGNCNGPASSRKDRIPR